MAVLTHATSDRTPSRLTTLTIRAAAAIGAAAQRVTSPHKAAVANLLHIPLTVTGTACIDYAAFHLGAGWGWLVTGLSLVLVEHIIADEQ